MDNTKTIAKIKKFCAPVLKMDKLPMPGGGDCWLCCMYDTATGKQNFDNISHVQEHVAENYLHGSLILSALRYGGVVSSSKEFKGAAYPDKEREWLWLAFNTKDPLHRKTVYNYLWMYCKQAYGLGYVL